MSRKKDQKRSKKMAGPRPATRLKGRKQNNRTGKGKMGNDESDSSPSAPKLDESVLKKPIETSVTGLLKAIQVIKTGTKEIRDYLANECEIIYECRVCRSMFRSVANFVLHKRSYCTEIFKLAFPDSYMGGFEDAESLFIHSENTLNKIAVDPEPSGVKPKDLTSIIERLAKKTTNGVPSPELQLRDVQFSDDDGPNNVLLSLQKVDGTNAGMFQTVSKYGNLEEFIKTELKELHMMENDGGAVIGPDGRCLGFRSVAPNDDLSDVTTDKIIEESTRYGKIECAHCTQKFTTRKTLRFHVNTKHNDSRLVYPCPDCSETYVNPWGVYRHLFKVHRLSALEVRKLRNSIQCSSYHMDQAPVRKTKSDPVLEVILTEQERLEEENKAWMRNLECDTDMQCCGGCGRRFERKAALHSHSLMCQKRIAVKNNFQNTKTKRVSPPDEKLVTKPTKGAVKRKTAVKKKIVIEDDNYEKHVTTTNVSRPPSEIGSQEQVSVVVDEIVPEEPSRRNSSISAESNSLKLLVSDDDSLQEVPLKDPLEVSDCENSSKIPQETKVVEDTTVAEILNDCKSNHMPLLTKEQCEMVDQLAECLEEIIDPPNNPVQESKHQRFVNDMLGARIKMFTTVGKKFVCTPCDYRYSSLASLRRHMAIHFNWKRFKCLRCEFMSFDKRESIVHAQTTHHATLDLIKKYVARMTESESDTHSSKLFLPLNTTPQEIITLDDSDEDSNKHLEQNKDDADENDCSQNYSNSNHGSESNNEFSRNIIMEMILGVSDTDKIVSLDSPSEILSSSREESPKLKLMENTAVSSRPVRNRVKPVNKDFIYDMSSLTKDDTYDVMYVASKSMKRKSDNDIKESEKNQTKSVTTSDTDSVSKKKRRRNSKIFLNSSNSNSSTDVVDVKMVFTSSSESNSVTTDKVDTNRFTREIETVNENSIINNIKKKDESSFLINNILPINT